MLSEGRPCFIPLKAFEKGIRKLTIPVNFIYVEIIKQKFLELAKSYKMTPLINVFHKKSNIITNIKVLCFKYW